MKDTFQALDVTDFEKQLKEALENPSVYFSTLKNELNKNVLSSLLGYFLNNTEDFNLLAETIKAINNFRLENNLDDLMDFLMTKTFKDKDLNDVINLKILCIKAISNYKDTKCIPALLYCLNDKKVSYKMRFQAAVALGKIGDKNAVEPLINIVLDENEKSVYVRESAATALGMIGDMRAIDPFLTILEARKNFLDKFTFLKERVIEALGKINFSSNKRVITAFKNAIHDDSSQVRINAIECLMNSGDENAYEIIKESLHDSDNEVIKNAVIALYNLKGKEALFEILKDDTLPLCAKEEADSIYAEYEEDENE